MAHLRDYNYFINKDSYKSQQHTLTDEDVGKAFLFVSESQTARIAVFKGFTTGGLYITTDNLALNPPVQFNELKAPVLVFNLNDITEADKPSIHPARIRDFPRTAGKKSKKSRKSKRKSKKYVGMLARAK